MDFFHQEDAFRGHRLADNTADIHEVVVRVVPTRAPVAIAIFRKDIAWG